MKKIDPKKLTKEERQELGELVIAVRFAAGSLFGFGALGCAEGAVRSIAKDAQKKEVLAEDLSKTKLPS